MADESNRDKYKLRIVSVSADVAKNEKNATTQQVNLWHEQLESAWKAFQESHTKLIARAGASEKPVHETIYTTTHKERNDLKARLAELFNLAKNAGDAKSAPLVPTRGKLQQAAHFRSLSRMANYINENRAQMHPSEIEPQRDELNRVHVQLQEVRLQRLADGEPEGDVIGDEDVTYNMFMQAMHHLAMAEPVQNRENNCAGPANDDGDMMKIPVIKIGEFNGRIELWESFRDSFEHIVHNRANMPAVQKLQYLKSLLKGEAEEIVRNFALNNENYATAWRLLNTRYNNTRDLVWSHMRVIVAQQVCHESADDLRVLMNRTASAVLALNNLGRATEGASGDWIVFHVVNTLDQESRRLWEQQLAGNNDIPTWEQLEAFLNSRVRSLAAIGSTTTSVKPPTKSSIGKSTRNLHSNQVCVNSNANSRQQQKSEASGASCPVCDGSHLIQFCEAFRKRTIDDRRGIVAAKGLCFMCISSGHHAANCVIKRSCQTCGKRHNTLLHLDPEQHRQTTEVTSNKAIVESCRTQVVLATAIICVQDIDGGTHHLRALLDQGSQVSFVSEETAQLLRLPRHKVDVNVIGIGGVSAHNSKQSILIKFHSRFDNNILELNALVIRRLTNIASVSVASSYQWPHIVDLRLADPEFLRPQKIDILIGSDMYGTLLEPGLRQAVGLPTAQKTTLGWILSGRIGSDHHNKSVPSLLANHCKVEDELTRFWEIEETQTIRSITEDEERCEEFFEQTVKRDDSGRLHVRLPLRDTNAVFGASQYMAVQRQLQLEKRFVTNSEFASAYRLFMSEYEQLGHMVLVNDEQVDMKSCRDASSFTSRKYYIPHHAVMKEASTSTKLRTVFDASRKSSNGYSLNDHMHIGPRLQDDLTAIVMRWRANRFGFSADIEKMYRQIMVDQPDADMQRIVWRAHSNEPMKIYRLMTVTYGTASAPYLAVKSLQTIAKIEQARYPIGAEVAMNSFYVDDVLSGAATISECVETQQQLIDMLASGGFVLRKWVSNCEDVLGRVPIEHRERQLPLTIDDDKSIKTLGIHWNPSSDHLGFNIPTPDTNAIETKRLFLSQAARLYDPLGWLAPSTILVKMLFQKLWKANINWDDPLPKPIEEEWSKLRQTITFFKSLRIPRWIKMTPTSRVQIHGFCDASMAAYAAVVFVRVENDDQNVLVNLVTAKTKVAPLKILSLPRLELCGASLLTKLIADVRLAMQFGECVTVTCWTDSTIVLAWLRSDPARFNVFVANRTSEIQRSLPARHWRHVRSEDNPADCASRGILPQKLIKYNLWWTGPDWLSQPSECWPHLVDTGESNEEVRIQANSVITDQPKYQWDLIIKISTWKRLTRITAWCIRFSSNCRSVPANRRMGPLTASELANARELWVKDAQGAAFGGDLRSLRNSNTISKSSSLISLNPVLSSTKVLRVGGRLANAISIPPEARSPAIIPRRCPLSALLIADAHEQTLHGGPSLMMALLRRSYWIVDGMKEAQIHVKRCTTCFRFVARPSSQQMGALPVARVEPSRPFRHTALDYSGAIMVRSTKGRGHHATKAYICVFVCLATKAAHIELASDLTTAAFIAAYERFVARRGHCSDIYSDNATNFVGASTVFLRSERKLFNASVQNTLAARGTTWHFSPPLSPHFNGMAESAIRSVKHHLRRIIGETTLTYEEMSTVLAKVEACLNSRPIHPLSNNISDLDVLTPAHFLIGEPTVTISPVCSALKMQPSALVRWKLTQQIVQRFWSRWSVEYLHTLQQRRKWQLREKNIGIGDLVLILEDNLPPTKWAIGRIIDTHPGSDGQTRVVTIRANNSTYKRSIVKVARLPIDDACENDNEQTNPNV